MKCAGEAGSYRPDQQHPASHPMHQQQAHRFTLAFKDNQLESNFRAWYDEAAAAHDQQVRSAASDSSTTGAAAQQYRMRCNIQYPSLFAVG